MDAVRRIHAAVARAFAEHGMRPENGRVLVACSGGPDSRSLLEALHALGAMSPVRPIAPGLALLRPMLTVSRAEVDAYVAARGLAVVEDPTNADLRYRRSRVRHEVLPLLRRERPDLDRALAELCER